MSPITLVLAFLALIYHDRRQLTSRKKLQDSILEGFRKWQIKRRAESSDAVEELAIRLLAFTDPATGHSFVQNLLGNAASRSATRRNLPEFPTDGTNACKTLGSRVEKDKLVMSATGRRRYGRAATISSRNLEILKVSKASTRWRDRNPSGDSNSEVRYSGPGFRLVRCMPHLKRRDADAALSAGRVLVNGTLVRPSVRVKAGDVVTLDGKVMNWEPFAEASESDLHNTNAGFVYLKYNKPRGVACTMEESDESSLLYALSAELLELGTRVFPVGRLDKHSSGLVLLTDDGRVTEALLDPAHKAEKEYEVDLDQAPTENDVEALAAGVKIKTRQQRGGAAVTAHTLPCRVSRIQGSSGSGPVNDSDQSRRLAFVLQQGRNRQIRKMCTALGLQVNRLHRTRISNICLGSLQPGELSHLEVAELAVLQAAVSAQSQAAQAGTSSLGEVRGSLRPEHGSSSPAPAVPH